MASTPKALTDFLLSLANDDTLASYNQRSLASADEFLRQLGLNADQRAAVLSRDVSAISYQLSLEGEEGDFFIPAGPVMQGPARFRVMLEGVMDPGPFPPTMDPLTAPRSTRKAAGPFPPTMDPFVASSTRSTSRRASRKRKGGAAAKKSRAAAKTSRKAGSKAKKAGGKRRKK